MDWKNTTGPRTDLPASLLARTMTRRKFLRMARGMMLGAAVMGVGGMTYATKIEPGWFDIVPVDLTLPRLDPAFNGFRLVQISDIHINHVLTGAQVSEVCAMALRYNPDLVALTGDFVDERETLTWLADELADALRPLVTQVQSIAVLGNHDYRMGVSVIRGMLAGLGVQELDNDVLSLQRGSAQFHFAGIDDIWNGSPDLRRLNMLLPASGAAVLLAHEPDFADISAQVGRYDLQISGHSHGGQVVLPLIGPPVLPHLGHKYPSGLYQVGRMLQYTNRGLGTTAPHMRFNCRPEVTVFTFHSGETSLRSHDPA